MPAMQPTSDQFREFRDDPYDGPIAQVNLLKFRTKSEYPEDAPEHGLDEPGAAAYHRYTEAFIAAAADAGVECLLMGDVERYFIGNGDWDEVVVMHFPSRTAFMAMLNRPEFRDMHRHREAGLLCQEVLTTRVRTPSTEDADT
jgi:uncharacterized protein (DUF1330 family)